MVARVKRARAMGSTLGASISALCNQHLLAMLERVAVDYNLSADELKAKYLDLPADSIPVAKPKKSMAKKSTSGEPRVPCTALVRGEPCKHKAQPGQTLCHLHNRVKKPKPDRVPCTGCTAKGDPCQVRAQPGGTLCHLHLGRAKKPKSPPKPVAAAAAPPNFCEPCAEPEEVETGANDLTADELQKRLMAIMKIPVPESSLTPTREALEHVGLDDEPDEFDESQMESPTSQCIMEKMKAFMGSASGSIDEDDEGGYLSE
jgi:hypothetical protein